MQAKGEVCGCPCKHAAGIDLRAGFIVCTVGKEKLCPECVADSDAFFRCHKGHKE